MTFLNYIYCPAGRNTWADVALQLKEYGFSPCIWLGDPVHDRFAEDNFPNCTVLDFYRTNLGRVAGGRYQQSVFNTYTENKPFFERLMIKTFDMMNRQDPLGRYSFEARKQVFYALVLYSINLIENKKPDFALFSEAAHSPAQFILRRLCSLKNITAIEFSSGPSVFPVITPKIDGVRGAAGKDDLTVEKEKIASWIGNLGQDYAKAAPKYTIKKDRNPIKYFAKLIFKYCKESVRKAFSPNVNPTYMIKNCVDGCQAMSRYEWKLKKRLLGKETRIRHSYYDYVQKIDTRNQKFVYFPLHYQPERTTNPEGGEYYDQFQALAKLRALLDDDVGIYIKEHPAQFWPNRNGGCARNEDYYRNLNSIGGICFVDTAHDAFELIDNSLLVATITGTVGVESIARGKPVLVFGDPWYKGIPGSVHIDEIDSAEKLDRVISTPSKVGNEDLVEFCHKIFSTSIYGAINPSNEKYFKNSMNHHIKDSAHTIATLIHVKMSSKLEGRAS
jgi:hypothetical protein